MTNRLLVLVTIIYIYPCIIVGETLAPNLETSVKKSLPQAQYGQGRLLPMKWSAGCGIDSLYIGLKLIGINADYLDLINKAGLDSAEQWVSINTLWNIARELGSHAIAIKVKNRKDTDLCLLLKERPSRSAILHLEGRGEQQDHLVCAYLTGDNNLHIAGEETFQKDIIHEWRGRWSGIALLLDTRPFVEGISSDTSIPKIYIKNCIFDAGKVENNSKFKYLFEIENRGNKLLNIDRVYPGCSCTRPSLDCDLVKSGQTAKLQGSVTVGNKVGKNSTRISILSNDPERPQIDVEIKWEVMIPAITFHPPLVNISNLVPGKQKNVTVLIKYGANNSIELEKLYCTKEWLRCVMKGDLLHIYITPNWTSGQQKGDIVLYPKGGKSRFKLPISVTIMPKITVSPTKLFWLKDEIKQNIERTVDLKTNRNNNVFSILELKLQGLAGTVNNIDSGTIPSANHRVIVKLDPSSSLDKFSKGKLLIKTDLKPMENIEIPIYVK